MLPSFIKNTDRCHRRRESRCGFTLVELLVVIGLLILLAAITASTINLTISGDKVRAASRQVQSYLEGARDRAIYAKAPRGVRFQVDPTNSRTVTSMVFIAPTDPWTQGAIQMERLDSNFDGIADTSGSQALVVRGFDNDGSYNSNNPTGWVSLYKQGLLRNGARILIPNDNTGTWYTITTEFIALSAADPTIAPRLHLTTSYIDPPTNPNSGSSLAFSAGTGPASYKLELPPTVLPNQDPTVLPKGTVIDLDRCSKTPASLTATTSTIPLMWINATVSPFVYSNQMDVMFSPRGTVMGSAAGRGLIHFYIAEQKDADKGLLPESPAGGDKFIVSLFSRTGSISVHPVDLMDTTTISGVTVFDYFRFAETGEVAGR